MADEGKAFIELILEVQDFKRRLTDAEGQFKTSMQQMAQAVRAGLDPSSAEWQELERRVKETGREFVVTGERGEHAMRELAALTGKGSNEVNELKGRLAIARAELDRFNKEGASGLGGVVKGFNGVRTAIAAVATSIVGIKVADFVRGSVAAAVEAEDALGRVQASIEATDGAAGRSLAQIEQIAKRIQETTTVGDEEVLGLANTLLSFEQIVGSTFDRTIDVVVDLSAKTRKGLEETGTAVAKALALGAEGISQLRRAGVVLREEEEERIKLLYESGRVTEGQNALLTALEGKAKGAAVALNDELGGALRNLKDEYGEVQEAFGKAFGDEIVADIDGTTDALKRMQPVAADLGTTVGALTGWFVKLLGFAWPALSASVTGFFALVLRAAVESGKGVLGFNEAVLTIARTVASLPVPGNVFAVLRDDIDLAIQRTHALRDGIVADAQAISEGAFSGAMADMQAALAALKSEAEPAGAAVDEVAAASDRAAPALDKATKAKEKAAAAARALTAAEKAAAAAMREAAAAAENAPDRDVFGRELDPKTAQQAVDALRKRKEALEAEVDAGGASLEVTEELARVKGELADAEARLTREVNQGIGTWKGAEGAIHGYEVAITDAAGSLSEIDPLFEQHNENVRRNADSVENLFGATARLIPKLEDGAQVTERSAAGVARYTVDAGKAAAAVKGLAEGQDAFNERGMAMAAAAEQAAKGAQQLGSEAKDATPSLEDMAKRITELEEKIESAFSEKRVEQVKALANAIRTDLLPVALELKACLDSIEAAA